MSANRTRGIVAVLGITLLLAACSSKGEQIASKIRSKIQRAGITVQSLSCDQKDAKKGDVFNCNATVDSDGTKLTYKVTMKSNTSFDAEPSTLAIQKKDLESALAAQGKLFTGIDTVTVDCGKKQIYTKDQVEKATCAGRIDGVSVPLAVSVDSDNNVNGVPAKPLVVKAKVESELVDEIAKAQNISAQDVTVDCGAQPVRVLDTSDATFTCNAKATDGSAATVTAKIGDGGTAHIVSAQ